MITTDNKPNGPHEVTMKREVFPFIAENGVQRWVGICGQCDHLITAANANNVGANEPWHHVYINLDPPTEEQQVQEAIKRIVSADLKIGRLTEGDVIKLLDDLRCVVVSLLPGVTE